MHIGVAVITQVADKRTHTYTRVVVQENLPRFQLIRDREFNSFLYPFSFDAPRALWLCSTQSDDR